MYKYCMLKFCDNYDYLENKGFFLKNKKFRDFYIKKFNPFKMEKFYFDKLEEYDGFRVTLPITKEDAFLDNELLKYLLEKTLKYLKTQDVNIIYYDEVFIRSDEIEYFKTLDVNLLFINDFLKKAIKSNNFARKDVSVSVVCGDYSKSCLVLSEIYNDLNFLNIVEKNEQFSKYEDLTDMIFCDCGLEISFSNNLRDADIIINLSDDYNNIFRNIRSNVIIIDLTSKIKKGEYPCTVIQGFTAKIKNSYLKDYELELILYSKNIQYRIFKEDDNKINSYLYLKSEMKKNGIKFNNYKIL